MAFTASDICKVFYFPFSTNCAIVFPPLGVFLERGCTADLLINCLLTLLGKPVAYHSILVRL
ncbi:plasma membrane proteolipid 3 [Suillus fuscotomentosus]|uniref:Plasma membrane proteolipid 3 n=1 Tax=Suillus fuscotomentosus TaxID=1912939 RepID=A0AAD4HRK0_9AGAM|nr:plasma membrane proteolipid 3 [Suillus fuscotomentosus]KAG1905951.1 plasma membrane proteolipid 3 [Suillus fuscotomentosus]